MKLHCGAIIDDEDAWVLDWGKGWYVPSSGGWKGYAVLTTMRFGRKKTVALHRVVMQAEIGELIDHRDGDPLNCQKQNLRRSSKRGNGRNMHRSKNQKRGGFKGVFTGTGSVAKPWRAQIGYTPEGGKLVSVPLGSFATAEEAARAYDAKARELFGEDAALNFPDPVV